MRWLVIFFALSFFLTACSSQSPEQKTFVHVIPDYQESVVEYEEFAVQHALLQRPTTYSPLPTTFLADAGDPCNSPGDCTGFCLAYRRNATQGFCSDTRTPEGCWEYVVERNVTRVQCS